MGVEAILVMVEVILAMVETGGVEAMMVEVVMT